MTMMRRSIPDDSVLIPAVPVAPTVKINADKIKAGASAVSVVVAGDVEEGSNLIIRQYASADAVQGDDWEFFGNKSVSEAGTVSVEKNSRYKKGIGSRQICCGSADEGRNGCCIFQCGSRCFGDRDGKARTDCERECI